MAPAPSGEVEVRTGPRPEPLQIARERPGVGQEMMPERDGLRGATVGRAGHDRVGVVAGALHERARQGFHRAAGRPAGREQPQAEIRHDQVVARSAGVQLGAERAEPVRHGPLDRPSGCPHRPRGTRTHLRRSRAPPARARPPGRPPRRASSNPASCRARTCAIDASTSCGARRRSSPSERPRACASGAGGDEKRPAQSWSRGSPRAAHPRPGPWVAAHTLSGRP